MPIEIKTTVAAICDSCGKPIPIGGKVVDFSDYGYCFHPDCMITMTAFDFSRLVIGDSHKRVGFIDNSKGGFISEAQANLRNAS
jgi:hypothetical protein